MLMLTPRGVSQICEGDSCRRRRSLTTTTHWTGSGLASALSVSPQPSPPPANLYITVLLPCSVATSREACRDSHFLASAFTTGGGRCWH